VRAVAAGIGIGQLRGHLALPLPREGVLTPLLDRLRPQASTMYVYRPHRTPVPRRVQLVFDELCKILADCEEAPENLAARQAARKTSVVVTHAVQASTRWKSIFRI
jgi:hypothetical protein